MIYDNLTFTGISIRSSAHNIIICDTQSDSVDIVQLHNHYINNKKMHGIPYHYIIFRSGEVHNTKPVNYELELYPEINNDICIALEGDTNINDLTEIQRTELISLANSLLEKECLSYFQIAILSDLVGGTNPGNRTNWDDIKMEIRDNWASVDKGRAPLINMSIDNISGMFQKELAFYTLKKDDNPNRAAHFLGTDLSNMKTPSQLTNTSFSFMATNNVVIAPNTPLIFKTNPIYQSNWMVKHQSRMAALITSVINNKINAYSNMLTASLKSNSVPKPVNYNLSITDNIAEWQNKSIELPGYSKAKLEFTDVYTGIVSSMPFVVSPSSFNDNRTTQQQMNKTTAGWFVMRMGQQMTNLSITGYMLDTEKIKERQGWIVTYNTYIRDTKDSYFQYQNKYTATLTIEGRTYTGFVQSISLSKSAVQQFLYQYNITFTALSENSSYNNLSNLIPANTEPTKRTLSANFTLGNSYIGNTLYSTLLNN